MRKQSFIKSLFKKNLSLVLLAEVLTDVKRIAFEKRINAN